MKVEILLIEFRWMNSRREEFDATGVGHPNNLPTIAFTRQTIHDWTCRLSPPNGRPSTNNAFKVERSSVFSVSQWTSIAALSTCGIPPAPLRRVPQNHIWSTHTLSNSCPGMIDWGYVTDILRRPRFRMSFYPAVSTYITGLCINSGMKEIKEFGENIFVCCLAFDEIQFRYIPPGNALL